MMQVCNTALLALPPSIHAVSFDLKRLGPWLAHVGMRVPKEWMFVDTYRLSANLKRAGQHSAPDNKLQTLRAFFGLPQAGQAHRRAGGESGRPLDTAAARNASPTSRCPCLPPTHLQGRR